MEQLEESKENGISPVISIAILLVIVVALASFTGVYLLNETDNQEASFSGLEISESEFSVIKMQSAERLIFKRSDGKLYYADQVGETIKPKSGEYTVIAQSGDGSKNVINTNVKADQKASITVDSFNNNQAVPQALSNNVENDLKLLNLKKNIFTQGRYASPIQATKMEKINNITIETGSSQDATGVDVSILTNFKAQQGEVITTKASIYKAGVTFGESAGKVKKTVSPTSTTEQLSSFPVEFFDQTAYGNQFKQEINNEKHKNSVIVRVETENSQDTDIERITVTGQKKADAFDTPRSINSPDPSAKIISTNSPFNESEGDSEIKVTGKVVSMEGNFSITILPPEEERSDPLPLDPEASGEIVKVQPGEQKTLNPDYPSPSPCGEGRTQEFGLVEVEKTTFEGSEYWVVKDIKDTVSYKIENVSGTCNFR